MFGTQKRVGISALAVGLVMALLAGCGIDTGIYTSQDQGDTTKKYRYEFELVPKASLVKEDTTPDWPLGRYAFVPGDQRLLVISRITSWADRPKDKKDVPPRIDRYLERVWVTIPAGTAVDQELKLEELESRFLAGYDMGDVGKSNYIQPSTLKGVVRIREERPESVLMRIDMIAEMSRGEAMKVKETVEVPIVAKGIRGTPAGDGAIAVLGRRHLVTGVPPSTTQPASDPSALGSKRLDEQSIVGKWEALQSSFHVRVQFDADERYAVSITPGSQSPTPAHVGKYHVSGETLTLYLDRTPEQGGGPSSIQLTGTGRWQGRDLVIEGSIVPGVSRMSMILRPSEFPTMRTRFVAHAEGK